MFNIEIYNKELVPNLDSKSIYNQNNSKKKDLNITREPLNLNDIKALLNNEQSNMDI